MILNPVRTKQLISSNKFRLACGFVIVTGFLILIGWQFGIDLLKGAVFTSVPVNPLTALLFILIGISALIFTEKRKSKQAEWLARIIAGAVLLSSFIAILESFGFMDLGLDQLLFHQQVVAIGSHMAAFAAICFLLISLALLTKDFKGQLLRNPSHVFVLMSLFVLLLSLLGYLYGVNYTYQFASARFYPIAFYSIIDFVILDIIILGMNPGEGFVKLLLDKGPAGNTMRRLIPIILVLTIVIGWIRFYLQATGIINYELLVTMSFTLYFSITAVTIWWNAKSLFQIDEQRKIVSTKAELQQNLLYSVISSVGEAIVVIDQDYKVLVANKMAAQLVGLNQHEMMGKDLRKNVTFLNGNNPLATEQSLDSLTSRLGNLVLVNLRDNIYLKNASGKKFPISGVIAPLKGSSTIKGIVAAFRDITKDKQIDIAKTEFVSLASHQLRTPLSTINWYTEMLLNGDAGSIKPQQSDYLDVIMHANKRMIGLVNSLLSVSQIELGVFSTSVQVINLVEICHIVLEELRGTIIEKKLRVKESYDKDLPSIMGDATYIKIIFQNLFSNAVNYSPVGGAIDISLGKVGKKLLLKVTDSGYGIPEAAKSKIFLKLFRADNIKTVNSGGTGLGLYLAKLIVDQLEGKIWFESQLAKGSTFFVEIPYKSAVKTETNKSK